MLSKIFSLAVCGVGGRPIGVEVDLAGGLPSFTTVGLPDTAVRESKDRVLAAIRNSGFDFPLKKITVNLSPSELRKSGTQYDLAMALGILCASGQIKAEDRHESFCFLGELALDGRLQPVRGVLPMALAAKKAGFKALVVPRRNQGEARLAEVEVYGAQSLREAADFLEGKPGMQPAAPPAAALGVEPAAAPAEDLSEVRGQPLAKRALEIAAAGGHNLLFIGPPGTGKSMLARRLPGVLPPLSTSEALEVAQIHSVCGLFSRMDCALTLRPFRSPHHTVSTAALVGGGSLPRPGEVSLAHRGVLFLDELPEFHRDALEALREPLEAASVTVSRAKDVEVFPADFMLVAAMNPCPCGYLGHPKKNCLCTPTQVHKYRSRVSGPLWDRIDLHVEVPPVSFEDWSGNGRPAEESSAPVRGRVGAAHGIQGRRFAGTGIFLNAQMGPKDIRRICLLTEPERDFLEAAMDRLVLSARSLDRILKVSRTIADLAGEPEITKAHLMEAVQYRTLDREVTI